VALARPCREKQRKAASRIAARRRSVPLRGGRSILGTRHRYPPLSALSKVVMWKEA
jgi:hypothetical protein